MNTSVTDNKVNAEEAKDENLPDVKLSGSHSPDIQISSIHENISQENEEYKHPVVKDNENQLNTI